MNHFSTLRRRALQLLPALALFALSLNTTAPVAHAQKGKGKGGSDVVSKTASTFLTAFKEPVSKASLSTFRVQCNGKDVALGVAVSADGFILTKFSDLEGNITVKMRDGTAKEAKLVGVHEPHDLAMLKIEAENLTIISWKDSKGAVPGNWIASPGPAGEALTAGVVSVATRDIPNAKIAPPAPVANSGYLGIGLADEGPGATISEVMPNSAAAKAGLKKDDVVIAVAGNATPDAETLIRTVQKFKAGETITLSVRRGEAEMDLKATLGKRPAGANRGDIQNNMGSKLSKRKTGFPVILQHDAILLPEDCGGPVVDLDGNVIGLNICRWGRVESYVVPAEAIRPVLNDLISGKLVPKGPPAKEKEKDKGEKQPEKK